jgi:hypothetical protein
MLVVVLAYSTNDAGTCVGLDANLPLPSTFLPDRLPEFQKKLTAFLKHGDYRALKWCEDKSIRDTGPYINQMSYGTHKAVKIYYSPEIMKWLKDGRRNPIPDGAMIVKEQYAAPAVQYQLKPPSPVADWTVMIKDANGSKDGWYWAEIWDGQKIDSNNPPYSVPNAGFGLYCARCHASAEKDFTFASLANIRGFPGQPLSYFVDLSWVPSMPSPTPASTTALAHHDQLLPGMEEVVAPASAPPTPTRAFVKQFNSMVTLSLPAIKKFPPETFDHVVADPRAPQQFLTSDSCMGCHSAIAYGNVMVYRGQQLADSRAPLMNVSPFGEWRWSAMGLAGRDPIFYAQLDSELAYLKTVKDKAEGEKLSRMVVNTCFRCHGVMGKRQFELDHGADANFDREIIYETDYTNPNFKYGALSREGVSCMACHHIVETKTPAGESPLKYFLDHSITGNFDIGKADQLSGPFEDNVIVTDPMNNFLGIKPKHDPYIKQSRMCGSCHTINLPVVDQQPMGHDMEQATYLEWLNSSFQNEFGNNPKAQTCQDCHMPNKYSNAANTLIVPAIKQPIATVQDDQYPAAEHIASPDNVHVRLRETGFARHQLQGLNVPLLEMFSQFMINLTEQNTNLPYNEILGLRQTDFMLGVNQDLPNAVDALIQQAQNSTANIEVSPVSTSQGKLVTNVRVTNKTGHRFPSGVGFRRAFIEFDVVDKRTKQIVWASGCTNDLGVIVDGNGKPLSSEFFEWYKDNAGQWRQAYQPHYYDKPNHTITRQDQVQIFEELTQNADGAFTTSFIRRDNIVKENRLLPLGWTKTGPGPSLSGKFLEATFPHGVGDDDHYGDGSGTSVVTYEVPLNGLDPRNAEVTATLYYQTIPPYYLKMRFEEAPDYEATRRLYYLTSNLNTSGTSIMNWKLKIVSGTVSAKQ